MGHIVRGNTGVLLLSDAACFPLAERLVESPEKRVLPAAAQTLEVICFDGPGHDSAEALVKRKLRLESQ